MEKLFQQDIQHFNKMFLSFHLPKQSINHSAQCHQVNTLQLKDLTGILVIIFQLIFVNFLLNSFEFLLIKLINQAILQQLIKYEIFIWQIVSQFYIKEQNLYKVKENLIIKMKDQFCDLLQQAKQKIKKSHDISTSRNHLNESYQQYEYLNMQHSYERLISNLEYLSTHSQVAINPQTFSKVFQSPLRYSTSLLTLCKNTMELLDGQQRYVRISHQHHSSQIVFLALFLKYCTPNNNSVKILTSKNSLKSWEKYLIDDKSTDPQSDLKALLEKENISVELLNEAYKSSITKQNHIFIIDLMNISFVDYQPYLLARRNEFNLSEKVVVYHSHDQDKEVQAVLRNITTQFFPVQASLYYPIEIQYTPRDSQIKSNLIQFLKQDITHPQKQDIIIFYKNDHLSNSTTKRFISKLSEILAQQSTQQHNLKHHTQFITQANQILMPGKNKIFVVENVKELIQWNYSYSDVFYVIDYGWDVTFELDEEKYFWVERLRKEDLVEKTKRMSFVGINKVGKYVYREEDIEETQNCYDRATQLMTYTLRMIDLGLIEFLDQSNKRVKNCLEILEKQKVIQKQNQIWKVIDQEILNFNIKGVDPIQARVITNCLAKQKQNEQKTLTNLLILAFAISNSRGNLRQSKDNISSKTVIKPSGVWRRSGYLHSCLEILTKAQILQSGKVSSRSLSRRKTSKMNEAQYEAFGNLFEVIVPKKLQFEDMQMEDLIREYYVNQLVFTEIRDKIDELRQIFNVQQTIVKITQKLVEQTVQSITSVIQKPVIIFSGSRRLGYLPLNSNNKGNSLFPYKDSLISQLNQTPQFLLVLRCIQIQGKRQILMCNNITIESFMSVFGQLPSKKSDSLAEHEIEFHGVSSSVFKGLYRNNSIEMLKFEQDYKCFIQPNEQMATITIYCPKQHHQKIKAAFDQLITKIKQKFINYNKIIHYLGNTNISMSNGGQIKQVIKDNYINQCYLNNLDLEVTQEDLEELFDEFFVLKDIEVLPAEPNKFSKSAIITFNSQKDYYRFYSYYNQCKYMNRIMDVKPIASKKNQSVQEEMYIDFKWYVWKSHRKAIVIFKNQQDAVKAYKALEANPRFDGKQVKVQLDKNKIILNDLNEQVDEIYLEKGFAVYGEIKEVQILKTPLKQPTGQENLLDLEIRNVLNIPGNQNVENRFKINQIEKHKNGLRKCKVNVRQIGDLNTLINKLNQVKKKQIGQGRLYAQSWFSKPIPIIYPAAIPLYQELLEQTINEAPQKPNLQYYLKDLGNNRTYLILKSPMNQTLQYISNQFNKKLLPSGIQLTTFQRDIILSDIGIDNIIDIQQKFQCKLIVNSLKKQLEVICRFKDLKNIKQQITARVEDKFFYRIVLNNNSYKNLIKNQEKLEEIKKTYFLSLLEIEEYSKTLIFEGSAHHVQNALNYMMHLIESFTVPEQELINTQYCLICYAECCRPYRLQNCGHKFCFGCLDQCINSTLGDMSMFPIKCPHCLVELTIDDLDSLIEKGSWAKLINMAANQFVGKNGDVMTFCFTAGCKQINMISLNNFKCDVCAQSYCTECKQRYHPGLTCQQAKEGGDQLFKKYMEQNGVRTCPNDKCKMPIVRTDGCFRVTCSRCNKSMCFKCTPDKMIAYDNYNDCYKHLNDVHGGYW